MDPRLRLHADVFALNTRLLQNGFDGLDEAASLRRPNDQTNHAAFIALHLIDARYYLAGLVGLDAKSPFLELTEEARGIEDLPEHPGPAELLPVWREVGKLLLGGFEKMTAEELDADSPAEFPIDDGSVLGGIAFLVQHEAYHIGQIGLLRKLLGYPAISYEA